MPPSNDMDYHVEKPTEKMFTDCCNEFWWVSTNVAKGFGEMKSRMPGICLKYQSGECS
jgi:hypothetical protein